MKTIKSINDFKSVNGITNLYTKGRKYYRLFGDGITPNGCWILNPVFKNLIDIDIATGQDIFSNQKYTIGVCGKVSADKKFITN